MQPKLKQFIAFCKKNSELAYSVVAAQAFAAVEKERVDAYTQPILDRTPLFDDKGDRIVALRYVWHCADESAVAAFYAECDKAHRAHGFTGPDGHCPALVADYDRIKAENAILKEAGEFFDVETCSMRSEDRNKMLDLVLGACLKDHRKAA